MIAAACLTLAAIYFALWCRSRKSWANLLFCSTAVSTAVFAFCELRMMRVGTPAEFATTMKWAHVPAWVLIVSLVGFVRLYLRAGRLWLAWTICGLRTFALLLNFLVGQNLNYLEVTRLRDISFLGESVSIPEGVRNPWMLVGQLSLVLLAIFVADASITVWRRGDHRPAWTVGGSLAFFILLSASQSFVVLWGIVRMPVSTTLFFMGVVAAMASELGNDTLAAARLAGGLRESEERMRLAVEAADFGHLDSRSHAERDMGDRQLAQVVLL